MVSPSLFRFSELLLLPHPLYDDPFPMAFIRGAWQCACRQPSNDSPSVWSETAGKRRFAANCINRYRVFQRCACRSAPRESSNIDGWQRYKPDRSPAGIPVLRCGRTPWLNISGCDANSIACPLQPGGEHPLFTATEQGLSPCSAENHW